MPGTERRFLFPLAAVVLVCAAPAGATTLETDMKCGRPDVEAVIKFPRESVSYDLEDHPDYKSAGRPLGLFGASHKLAYKGKIQAGCLKTLTVTIDVTPEIFLRSVYRKKSKKCARQLVLDHEQGHARVARREYAKLEATIEKEVPRLFTHRKVPDNKTAEEHLTDALEGDILPAFQKRYNAAQEGFHGKLAQADIIKKKCRLVKRKR